MRQTILSSILCSLVACAVWGCGDNSAGNGVTNTEDSATERHTVDDSSTNTAADTATETKSDSTDPQCVEDTSHCMGNTVQKCVGGQWTEWDECLVMGKICATLEGVAQCVQHGTADTGTDTDTDTDTGTDTGTDTDTGESLGDCSLLLPIIVRDFTSAHLDFERVDLGWGPAQGMVKSTLGAGGKPVFNTLLGEYQTTDPSCSVTCPNGGFLSNATPTAIGDNWSSIPMWEGETTFQDWYNDVPGTNMRVSVMLMLDADGKGGYVYDNQFFFPLANTDGFGAEAGQLDSTGTLRNFLFTTEMHLQFVYTGQGQTFTFRGDDDVWIFVNNTLALDLGGLHWPYQGTIDFDAMAAELGLTPKNTYKLDFFHAERHTNASNFHIETNIDCFIPGQ